MPLCCVDCKPCNTGCIRALFKCRRPTFQLRRALGKMKVGGGRRRRRRAGSFSSVRAVFWPLMSMRSDADARADDRPPSASTDDSGGGARAPSPSLADDSPRGAASTTAARVLALQARLGDAASSPPARTATTAECSRCRPTRLGGDAATPPPPMTKTTAEAVKAGSIRVQAVREHAKVVVDEVEDVEVACRSFEKHLMEMLVEERKVMDLTEVEELLCCWEKLRSPVFVQLVGRFYGELCMDLFSGGSDDDDDVSCEQQQVEIKWILAQKPLPVPRRYAELKRSNRELTPRPGEEMDESKRRLYVVAKTFFTMEERFPKLQEWVCEQLAVNGGVVLDDEWAKRKAEAQAIVDRKWPKIEAKIQDILRIQAQAGCQSDSVSDDQDD
ncbi:hypothetical protein PR202_ga28792 [Eleusine coracana subsp. coracana]|uniref:OVATE domain-containing protein n=1 Tax=Eleusine coracana subsp. coracana TaxID=191504 RepID=A0AAV5DKP1_ELECO|nr:hypothetical protein PR202_ga28792 [Eleusine coracana subsp. coracana]